MKNSTNRISMWLAKADNVQSLDTFLKIEYSNDGFFLNSAFGIDFMTGYYDECFREAEA
jgi:hypothetical protein